MLNFIYVSFTSPPILIIFCIFLFLILWKSIRRTFLLKDTPLSKIQSAAQGYVEITGKAAPLNKTINSPFSNVECCWFSYKIEVDTNNGYEAVASYKSGHCFQIQDATGEAIVYPLHADIKNIESFSWSQHGQSFNHKNEHSSQLKSIVHFIADRRYRITEQRILEGEEITVLGFFQTVSKSHDVIKLKQSEENGDSILDKIKKRLSKLDQRIHRKNRYIQQAKIDIKSEEHDWDYIKQLNQKKPVNIIYKHNRDFILSEYSGKNLSTKYKKKFLWLSATLISILGWTTYITLKYGILNIG